MQKNTSEFVSEELHIHTHTHIHTCDQNRLRMGFVAKVVVGLRTKPSLIRQFLWFPLIMLVSDFVASKLFFFPSIAKMCVQ